MNKIKFQQTLLAAGFLALAGNTLHAEKLAPEVINDEGPSLDLLLYLGEFQDRDGSLLEPEFFDESLKLKKHEDNTDAAESDKQQISEIIKEDDHEQSQP